MSPLSHTSEHAPERRPPTADEVQIYLEQTFPDIAALPAEHVDRRRFMQLAGASLMLAGATLTGCRRWPVEEIRPHASQPPGTSPGVPQYYATCFELDGTATGILAKSYDGRPIKIEGNPDHPYSVGAADALIQASILELYDPERHRQVIEYRHADVGGASGTSPQRFERTWADFQRFARAHFGSLQARRGQGLALIVESTSSPTLARLQREMETSLPAARWFTYHTAPRETEWIGSQLAFGRALRTHWDLTEARTIALFDLDLLGTHPARLRWARDWSAGRHSVAQGWMNRLYVVEPGFSITGSVADRRLALKPSLIGRCVSYLATRLGVLSAALDELSSDVRQWLDHLLDDLQRTPGASIVAVGPGQTSEVHQWAHAINHVLQNVNRTVSYTDEPLMDPLRRKEPLEQFADALQGNAIHTVVILGGNPVYHAPGDIRFAWDSTPARPLTTIHLTYYENETSSHCQWVLPAAHFLECWGDGQAWDGTWTMQQPLIQPLFGGRSPLELLALIRGDSATGLELVRGTFEQRFPEAGARGWEHALHDGLVRGSAWPWVTPPHPRVDRPSSAAGLNTGIEARFVLDYKVHDGRFANNAWLQELPDPLTKLTWDNAALISKVDADRWGIRHGDVIRLEADEPRSAVEIAAFIMPGHAEGCISLPLGYGRRQGGLVGTGVGFDVHPLRSRTTAFGPRGVRIERTGRRYTLVVTQLHHLQPSIADVALRKRLGEKGQPGLIVHEATLAEFLHDQHAVHAAAHPVHPAPLFDPPHTFDSPHRWGMTIDLNACIGCSGCVIACQAENNIPVVGKTEVGNNREMHWLRIDRYFKGSWDDPDVVHLPITCAHCESAPCEQVCPVAATVHDSEGLNAMVYNRCIGTRYCSNNCPLKVRRFNYLEYHAKHPRERARPWLGIPDQQQASDVSPLVQLMHNPEVTVRMRGVMEKCTYCLQRIVAARVEARRAHQAQQRPTNVVADGEVQTACQAACPTQAIRFGDLNDPHSAVSEAKRDHRHYEILEELQLRSRTTHLAKIRNR